MKKKNITTLVFVLSAFALTSCTLGDIYSYAKTTSTNGNSTSGGTTTTSSATDTTATWGLEPTYVADLSNSGVQDSGISTYNSGDESGSGYTKKDISAYRVSNYASLSALHETPLSSVGVQKILVVPVSFSNTTIDQDEANAIAKAYNGEPSDTGWQSLRSFYRNSSYGRLTINSTITAAYQSSYSTTSFQSYAETNGSDKATDMLASKILSALASKYTLSDYDNDGDGYIDGFEMVYDAGSLVWDGKEDSSTEVWWNFTSFDSSTASYSGEKVGTYFWSRIKQLENGFYTTNIDAHTLIHETGHMLGLDDYYSYDDDEGPAALCDMMDMNIGDHDAYSKMLLGWVKPMVLNASESSVTLTLNSFTQTGDCVLLRNTSTDTWNGTPYDEYLLLQYYTPTYLNKSDASGYKEWAKYGTGSLYKKAGLQVFHVDARIANITTSWKTAAYTDTPSASGDYIISSNTGSYSINLASSKSMNKEVDNSPYRLLKAIPATGTNLYGSSTYIDNLGEQTTLFGTSAYGESNATYTNSKMSALFTNGTKFNDGSTLNWSFTATNQTSNSIDVTFTKTA